MSQEIRDLLTQRKTQLAWDAYLAHRKSSKRKDRPSASEKNQGQASLRSPENPSALPVANLRPDAAPLPGPPGEALRVGHNKCSSTKG